MEVGIMSDTFPMKGLYCNSVTLITMSLNDTVLVT